MLVRRLLVLASLVLAGAALMARPVLGVDCTTTWDGGGGNLSWQTAANWSTDLVPGSGDWVCIPDISPDIAVTYSGGTSSILGFDSFETLSITGGTLNLTDAVNASTTSGLSLSTGTLGGAGTINVTSNLNWTSGTMTGAGTTLVAPGATANITGPTIRHLSEGRLFRIEGDAVWTGASSIWMGSTAGTAAFEVAGTLDIQGTPTLFYWYGTTRARNTGTITKSISTGTASFEVPFTNDGAVQILAGTFRHAGFGTLTHTGTYNGSIGATIEFTGSGTNTLSGPAPIVSSQAMIKVTSGTWNISGGVSNSPFTLTSGNLNFNGTNDVSSLTFSSGFLGGTGTVNVTGTVNWTGGTMTGAGTTRVAPGATANITGTANRYISEGRLFRIEGDGVWSGGSNIWMGSTAGTAAFEVAGTLDIQGTSTLVYWYGTTRAKNTGTITKSTSTGTASFEVPFTNDGAVQVLAGTFRHAGFGTLTHTGTYNGSAAATIEFSGSGTNTLSGPAPIVSSQAMIRVTSGTWNMAGGVSNSPFTMISGNLNFNGTNDVSSLTFSSGTLGGNGTVTISGTLNWTSGTMTGAGTTRVAPGATANFTSAASRYISEGRLLRIEGDGIWSGDSNIWMGSSVGTAAFEVAGTLDIQGTSTLVYWYGTARAKNTGTITKSISGTASFEVPFTNDGAVQVLAGTFRHAGFNTLTHTGTYNGSTGATIEFGGSGTNTLTNAAPVSASQATLRVAGGTWTVNGTVTTTAISGTGGISNFNGTTTLESLSITGGTHNFNTSVQVVSASISNGTLGGTGTVNVTSSLSWASGTMTGAGTTRVAPGATANFTSAASRYISEGRLLRIEGDGIWSGSSNIWMGSNVGTAAFEVAGTFDIQGNSTLVYWYGNARAKNTGVITKSISGTASFEVPFTNDGVVQVLAGTFRHAGFNTLPHTGTYSGSAGTTVEFSGSGANTLTNAVPVSASQATLRITGGTWTVNGTVTTTAISGVGGISNFNGTTTLESLSITGGTHNFNTSVQVASASVSNGTLGGTGTVTISGTLNWTSGTMTGAGTTRAALGATANFTSAASRYISEGRLLRIEGNGIWSGGSNIWMGSNVGTAALEVAGTLDIQGDSTLVYWYGTARAKNTGVIRKTVSTGTATFGVAFDNWGTLSVEQGTLNITTLQSFNTTNKKLLRGAYNVFSTLKFNGADIVTNEASITLDGATATIVDQANTNGLRNFATNAASGTLRARNGKVVTAPGQITNAGLVDVGASSRIAATGRYLQTAGTTRLADASAVLAATGSSVDITGGVLEGIGRAEPVVNNTATVMPGLSPGSLTSGGNYSQGPGVLIAELAGTAPGQFDTLEIQGNASLGGTLRIVTSPSYSPQIGDTFRVLNFASATGTFTDLEGTNIGGGLYYRVIYRPTNVTLVVGDGLLGVDDTTVDEGDSGTTDALFTVYSPTGIAGSVDYQTSDITAVAGLDYLPRSGTLTFLPGETSKTVAVPVIGDTLDEPNETFRLLLSNALSITIGHAEGRATITDDDVPVSISVSDVTVTETNATAPASFPVSLSAASGHSIVVAYATANGTATTADYAAASGTLTFAPGETTKIVTIGVAGDLTDEFDEDFFLDISAPTNATIADGRGAATIVDDDAAPEVIVYDASAAEGDVGSQSAFPLLQLSRASAKPISMRLTTSDGSATAPDDYSATGVTVTFTAGQTQRFVPIPLTPDIIDEPNENFSFTLSEPVNVTITDATGNVLIVDDDAPATIYVYDSYIYEGDAGTRTLGMTVALSDRSGFQISVDFSTVDGTAAAGSDYVGTSGTLVFQPGETSKQVAITIASDLIDETDETFFLDLSNTVAATINRGRGTGIIYDDDAPPAISISDASVTEGDAGAAAMQFTVQLSDQSGQEVTVDYATQDEDATSADYVSAAGSLQFLPGERTKSVSVQVLGDTLDEFDEFVRMDLSAPSNGAIGRGTGRGRIIDNDAEVSVSISDTMVVEGDDASVDAGFVITLSAPSAKTVSFTASTSDGTATGGTDYASSAANVEFTAGQTQTVVPVAVFADTVDEPNESFSVNLAGATNAQVLDGIGIGTIIDNDPDCTILGTPGDDILLGTPGEDVICGLAGNDIIYGLESDDILIGGTGDDTLIGGAGDDLARGQDGVDSLIGGLGLDVLLGDLGDDKLDTRDLSPGDLADGGEGTDACEFDEGDEVRNCP